MSISPGTAGRLAIEEGDVLRIDPNGHPIELPAHIQPGHHDDVASVALGYGHVGTDRFTTIGPQWLEAEPTVSPGELVGTNAAVCLAFDGNNLSYDSHVPLAWNKTAAPYVYQTGIVRALVLSTGIPRRVHREI